MVGKGLGLSVLGEMFFYAGVSLVPMALPLSILLASLMSFGNLGESLELLAIKSAGISLLKIMRPVIVTIGLVAIGAYFFQNNVLPVAQVKFFTLLNSIKQKSPELDIPEGTFYKEIPGYNVYVKSKDKDTGVMYDMMIYDYSKGFESATVTIADTGKLKMSVDKTYLILDLYNGESFENLRSQQNFQRKKSVPYRREMFKSKKVFIPFDANFNMMDESIMQGKYIGKNQAELKNYIDSVKLIIDSMDVMYARNLQQYNYMQSLRNPSRDIIVLDGQPQKNAYKEIDNFDSYFDGLNLQIKSSVLSHAKSRMESISSDYIFKSASQNDQIITIRQHQMELHRKFTLSFACLVFLFIGAPLGAIIRKGGLGMPVVISVFLFIFYYIIDTFGVKMARQGIWTVWQGMWLSSAVLFPLGVFLTYKAVNDSAIFNPDAYVNFFNRFIGKRDIRNYSVKEVIMEYPHYPCCLQSLSELNDLCENYLRRNKKKPNYISFWKRDFNQTELKNISVHLEGLVEELRNSDKHIIIGELVKYPILIITNLKILNNKYLNMLTSILFPIGLVIYFIGLFKRKQTLEDLVIIKTVNEELKIELGKIIDNGGEVMK